MQILIDLSDTQMEAVLRCAKERGISGSEVIREVVVKSILCGCETMSSFIGMLADNNPYGDGLQYQDKLRAEWE